MQELAEGLLYSDELNKMFYSNDFIMNSGLNLERVSDMLGSYAEYISDDERDLLYARASGIKTFDENIKSFNYSLSGLVDTDTEIELLKEENPSFGDVIQEEYDYVLQTDHNQLLLRMAFLLKRHLDKTSNGVYLMRGSGVSSYIFYAIGLNKVNPYKFGLDYRNFWNN
jgi:hypothetical protein